MEGMASVYTQGDCLLGSYKRTSQSMEGLKSARKQDDHDQLRQSGVEVATLGPSSRSEHPDTAMEVPTTSSVEATTVSMIINC